MEVAPLHEDIAKAPSGGAAHWLTTTDGLRIRVAHWRPAGARGTVLIFPGRTEYIEKYGHVAASFAAKGLASAVIDWRGQGLAQRLIDNPGVGHVLGFEDYQQDVAALVAHARALDLPQPWYLLAHSMGGCIGLRAVMEGLEVRAVSFSAPMWGVLISSAMRPLAWGLSSLSLRMGFDHRLSPGQTDEFFLLKTTFGENMLTNDEAMFEDMRAQLHAHPELGLGGPSLRWLNAALREMRDLHRRLSPDLPCLTWLGSREGIVDPDRIRSRMARWPKGRLREVEGGQHEMLMDTAEVRAMVMGEIAAHFDAHR